MTRSSSEHFLITKENPSSPISEAYKTLRTNIRFSALGESLKLILVTSAGTGEGRTTTAMNLAVTYAQENKNVLLLDADMRRPSINQVFFRSSKNGLSNVLIGQLPMSDVIVKTDIPNLSVLTSGTIPPNPSELLGSERMRVLLETLREQYDIVIIDSPPALSVTDAQILGAMCDGVILVVKSGKVTKDAVRRVRTNMEHVNARILGAVLNHTHKSKIESYYASYYGGD